MREANPLTVRLLCEEAWGKGNLALAEELYAENFVNLHPTPWRALLENPHSGERAAFATLAELVAFLEEKTGETIRP